MEVIFMQVVVINLKKHRLSVALTGIAVVLIVLLSVAVSVVTKIWNDELFLKASTDISDKYVIILDAGHGGEDCGAIGADGVYEKDLNLQMVMHIGEQLQAEGYAVVYTRTEDKLLYLPEEDIKGLRKISDLKNRCKVAAEYPDALFISIHMNSFGDSRYSGAQVYYSDSEGSYSLAAKIQESVKAEVQSSNNRKIKKGEGMYLLENIENDSVLVECGFLSNPEECKKLSEKEYQKRLSFSIVCGIIEYIEEKHGTSED